MEEKVILTKKEFVNNWKIRAEKERQEIIERNTIENIKRGRNHETY